MRVNFKSTYEIDYSYRLYKVYGYASISPKIIEFIDKYSRNNKGKDEISAINIQTNKYYIKMPDKKDFSFENLAKAFGINKNIKKVNARDMEGAIITSIGKAPNEIERISKKISAPPKMDIRL